MLENKAKAITIRKVWTKLCFFKFIWYCIQCMFSYFTAMFGYTPKDFTIKDCFLELQPF